MARDHETGRETGKRCRAGRCGARRPVSAAAPSAGRVLVDVLAARGVGQVFCVPGESYLPLLDALRDRAGTIDLLSCRHEAGAGFMAEAAGKLTGRAGVLMVTRGPGACNASLPIHVARQDSTPMVVLVGQVPRGDRGRDAFQEVDYAASFAGLAKAVIEVSDSSRIAEQASAAFELAEAHRQGPVLLVLPEDVLAAPAGAAQDGPPAAGAVSRADPEAAIQELAGRLAAAERPLLLVGGNAWQDTDCRRLAAIAEDAALPVACAFRRQDLMANDSPAYAGYLGLNTIAELWDRVAAADCVIALGTRLDQQTSRHYALFESASQRQRLVQLYPGAAPPRAGTSWHRLAPAAALECLAAALGRVGRRWPQWCEAAHADWLAWRRPASQPGRGLDLAAVCAHLDAALPADAVVTIDAGNFTAWPQRYLRFTRPRRFLAPVNGAMGYGVPAAVGAAALAPDRCVVCLVGDGGLLMTGMELATALQHGLRPIICVVNNAMYGTIRLHQERRFPGRPIGSDLRNPDFPALAASFGAFSARVERNGQFPEALAAARASGRAAVIELCTDPEVMLPGMTLADLGRA